MSKCELEILFKQSRPGGTKGLLTVRQNGELLHSDVIDIAKDKDRTSFANKLHKLYPGVSDNDVRRHLIEEVENIIAEERRAEEEKINQEKSDPLETTPTKVKDDALAILKSPDLFEQISSDIASMGVAGEKELCLTIYIVMTSRLLEKPVSVIIQGASASALLPVK